VNTILRSLAVVVGIPTLVATIYFGLFASDIYVSEARFAIKSSKASSVTSGLAAMLSPMVSGGGQDSAVVAEYVHSQDMLQRIQQRMNLVQHYSHKDVDALSRLDEAASNEEMLDHFTKHVDIVRDSASDVISLKVRAYDPAVAKELADNIIQLSEELVNTMSARIEEDALQSARDEVERAKNKVHTASTHITRFQNENASLNPAAESSAILGMVTGIETKLIEARAQLSEKLAYMREDSPEVVSLKNRVNALSRQLRMEKGRVVGGDGNQMNNLIESYQPLMLDQEMAQQQYASALVSLEAARIEAQRKKQYLITFIQPTLPDQAIEPRRLMEILTVMLFSFLLYLIGGLLWSALKDHIGR
jgi:capsular polysaccharide transport system permease protein